MPESLPEILPEAPASPNREAVRPLRVLLAGGGTAGHVNPLLATAAALRDPALGGDPHTEILVLGTKEGLESRLVPEAGYELAPVPRVPLPRRPSMDLLRLPARLRGAVTAARKAIEAVGADVVVGFGGYVSTPAYLAARSAGVPVVIHEQNARPGLANRLGARWAAAVGLTFASTPLRCASGRTEVVGLPLRPVIASLAASLAPTPAGSGFMADAGGAPEEARLALRRTAAERLGVDPGAPILLVTGGSLGALSLNEVMIEVMASGQLPEALQVLHLTGRGKDASVRQAVATAGLEGRYHVLDYLTTMEDAYAVADGVMCRSGAGTVAELSALGMPALYVPLPIGNGEQRLNAADVLAAGGGRLVADHELTASVVLDFARLIMNSAEREAMACAAASTGRRDGAERLAALIREVAGRPVTQPTVEDPVATTAVPSRPLAGQTFHLIGVGGSGMSVVAQLLVEQGARVLGSDAHEGPALDHLREVGVEVFVGHDAAQVLPEARVVVSTAIKESNPELAAARERGQEVLHRSEALALAAQGRRFVAVAGAHGKTTTSAMLAEALHDAGADPSFAVGGVVRALGTGAHVGRGEAFIAEADESDRSFLNYTPTIEVVTNVEPDHLDNYGSREAFEEAFAEFSRRLVPGGLLVACSDDPGALRLAQTAAAEGRRVLTFGAGSPEDLPAGSLIGEGHVQLEVLEHSGTGTRSRLTRWSAQGAEEPVSLSLATPGAHVALDAAGAWGAGVELGVAPEAMARALAAYQGAARRFELRGEADGVRIIDDYAHHPTEVAALLRAAREAATARGGKVVALFQPHLFSRTRAFAREFSEAFTLADHAIITGIYPARESAEDFPGVTGALIVEAASNSNSEGASIEYVAQALEAADRAVSLAHSGDLLLTIGAGDVTNLGGVILEALREREAGGVA